MLLALDRPTAARPPLWLIHADSVLSFIFLGEFALKLTGFGRAYWRGGALNWLDAVVACEGGFSAVVLYAASSGGVPFNISVLRMARLVRPLRTLNRFPSVRTVVDALMQSMVGLASILGILAGALRRGEELVRGARRLREGLVPRELAERRGGQFHIWVHR